MSNRTGLMLVSATALISGLSVFVNKLGLKETNPYFFAFAKAVIVSVILCAVIINFDGFSSIKSIKRKQWLYLAAVGLIGGSIPFLLFFKGLSMASAANAAFIHKSMFIFIMILAGALLHEQLNKKIFLAAALLFTGNLILLRFSLSKTGFGELLVFIATLLWAVENTLSKYLLKEINPRVLAFSRMFFGSIFMLMFITSTGDISTVYTLEFNQWLWIGITSLFLTGYVLTWYSGIKYIDVSLAACILLLGSPISTMLEFVFLNGTVTLTQAIGFFAIALGAGLAAKASLRNYAISTATA